MLTANWTKERIRRARASVTLWDLELPVRCNNALLLCYQANVNPNATEKDITVEWIHNNISRKEFFQLPNIGRKSVYELEEALEGYGFKLRSE